MDIIRDFNLKQHNTFGLEAKAALCTIIHSLDDLRKVISENRSLKKELYPLGGGSNILLTADLDLWVLINEMRGIEVVKENDQEVVLNVKSGENWHQFVIHCLAQKWYGLENLSLIPGLVGASPIQNIGAYGVEVKDFIESVNYLDLDSGEELSLSNSEMNFGYRNSIFKNELKGRIFITSVRFKLHKSPKVNVKYKALTDEIENRKITDPSPKDVSDAVIAVRKSKLPDPAEIGNSGSFFKNPVVDRSVLEKIWKKHPDVPFYPAEEGSVKLAAGWLIEKAGWKGFREGDIGVHEKQALVLVNYGKGRGEDIKLLSQRIIDDIKDKFDVLLEREVNIL
jgi:UDP-N-acetylmuramate dehydrogenase